MENVFDCAVATITVTPEIVTIQRLSNYFRTLYIFTKTYF